MNTSIVKLARLLAALYAGAVLLTACATSSGSVSVPSTRNCDPTGDTDARRACNR